MVKSACLERWKKMRKGWWGGLAGLIVLTAAMAALMYFESREYFENIPSLRGVVTAVNNKDQSHLTVDVGGIKVFVTNITEGEPSVKVGDEIPVYSFEDKYFGGENAVDAMAKEKFITSDLKFVFKIFLLVLFAGFGLSWIYYMQESMIDQKIMEKLEEMEELEEEEEAEEEEEEEEEGIEAENVPGTENRDVSM